MGYLGNPQNRYPLSTLATKEALSPGYAPAGMPFNRRPNKKSHQRWLSVSTDYSINPVRVVASCRKAYNQ